MNDSSDPSIQPHERYRVAMVEIKQRLRAIDRVLGAKKPRTLTADLDNEFMWLQVRKIVELVAFGGVMADEGRYATLRAEAKDNPNYRRDWKVGQILRRLAEITPHYLPRPLGDMLLLKDGTKHFEAGKEKEALERFVEIYEVAGEFLHAPNPFDEEGVERRRLLIEQSRVRLETEVKYLKDVLWIHVKIGLAFEPGKDDVRLPANPETAWIVLLGPADDDEVRMALANAMPE
ncbi:hypothetical protein [Pelomonas sp. Root1444]|uniref:hypothetical protein n=1 Tax=Pelomonas sp. Root1444 TaxID=1736464 RepID=UPI00070351A8|nr:hypothetical protein [Pelomonas sp. Root1444]KQY80846.1 hypothetical protein ASD35_03070 [Pelomonas sp. Root1444]